MRGLITSYQTVLGLLFWDRWKWIWKKNTCSHFFLSLRCYLSMFRRRCGFLWGLLKMWPKDNITVYIFKTSTRKRITYICLLLQTVDMLTDTLPFLLLFSVLTSTISRTLWRRWLKNGQNTYCLFTPSKHRQVKKISTRIFRIFLHLLGGERVKQSI